MRTVIFGGVNNALHISATEYTTIYSKRANAWNSNSALRRQICSGNGNFAAMFIKLTAAPGAGSSYTFTLRKNNAATALTVTIAGTDTTGAIYTDVAMTRGDRVNLQCTPGDTAGATPVARWAFLYEEGDGDGAESVLIGGHQNDLSNIATEENQVVGGELWGAGSFNRRGLATSPGTIGHLYVQLSGNAGFTGGGYNFRLMKNGSPSNIQCDILGTATTCNHNQRLNYAAGDNISIRATPTGLANVRYAMWGAVQFNNDESEYNIYCSTANNLHTTATEYNYFNAVGENWVSTESGHRKLAMNCYIKNFYVELSGTPGAGTDYTFTLMVNGVASLLAVKIGDTDTTGSDTTSVLEISDFDELTIRCVPSGTPTSRDARWGYTVRTLNPYPDSKNMGGIGI